jgi:multidrug efflux system membrane fusion protein
MVVDVRKGAIVIPSAGVQRGAQGTVVYIVKEDNTVTLRPVVVGPTEGLLTAIEQGVAVGERVITDGIDRIREGSKVEVTEATAAGTPVQAPPKARGEGKGGRRGREAPVSNDAGGKKPDDATPKSEAGGDARKRFENMDPAKREEFKKRLEGMTPEQREEFRKRRQEKAAQ